MRWVALPIILSLFLIACESIEPVEIVDFETCIAAGNPAMESSPRQCRANDQTFTEIIEVQTIACTPDQRGADACIALYQPVCAKVNVVCVTTPCDPVYETYSNSCEACTNELVESYSDGECL